MTARISGRSWAQRTSSASWRCSIPVLEPAPLRQSLTFATVWLDRATLRAWMAYRPVIAEQLLQALTQRLQHTEDQLVELVSSDVAARVARQLLLLARCFGTPEGDALRVTHELSQDEIAQLVGADRVSVNKALRHFTARGWILLQGKSVLIVDPDGLAGRAAAGTKSGVRSAAPTARYRMRIGLSVLHSASQL